MKFQILFEKGDRHDATIHYIEIIKNYLDSLKELQLFIKPLIGARFDAFLEKDNKFY